MTKPTLTVVGGKAPEPDARLVGMLRQALADAESGKVRGALIVLDVVGDIPTIDCIGDALRLATLADLSLPEIKKAGLL